MTLNTIFQVIIFFYLLDNDTSWMIIISSGVGLLIEFWKLKKAMIIEIDWEKLPNFVNPNLSNNNASSNNNNNNNTNNGNDKDNDNNGSKNKRKNESTTKSTPKINANSGFFGKLLSRLPIVIKDRESYSSKTKEIDDLAMKYLSWVLYPLVFGYAVYSLIYQSHKSWYSWILSSLTGCVYTFGFIMMTPQLFINYKLKSVAHLPWRTFTYKALNTFIDDLFAFIIKMPTLHRLSCFRDDVIFIIYLYQRWIYRVDYSRVNEFGQGGTETETEITQTTSHVDSQSTDSKKND